MSIVLDNKVIEVGYFLSRLGIKDPPVQLNAKSWKEAYAKFYSTFGGAKDETEFKNSLKNIRDHFDGYLENSRTGWMDKNGTPQKLSSSNKLIFDELQCLSDRELWARIKPYAVLSYDEEIASKKSFEIKEKGAKYFTSEFNGVKKVRAQMEMDIQVFHGLIVDHLKVYVEKNNPSETVFNNKKIDLACEENGNLKKVFEVKTSSDSQSIYTAVGQLFMHSAGSTASKYIVLPMNVDNSDLVGCLDSLEIKILWFTLIDGVYEFKPHV